MAAVTRVISTPMQLMINAIKGGAVKRGTVLSYASKAGKPINIKCVEKQGDCFVLEKTIQNGDKALTGRFTYLKGKLQPHIVTETTPRGMIEHNLTAGRFCTPYGNLDQLGKAKLTEGQGTFSFYGPSSNPLLVQWNQERAMAQADKIIPKENFKNILNYIRG